MGMLGGWVAAFVAVASVSATAHASGDVDSPDEWLTAHGVAADAEDVESVEGVERVANDSSCVEIVVGVKREDALACNEIEEAGDEDAYRVITHRIVRVVRAGRMITVLDVPFRFEPLDGVVSIHGGTRAIFAVTLTMAADGLSAAVEGNEAVCKKAVGAGGGKKQKQKQKQKQQKKKNEEEEEQNEDAWEAFDGGLVKRLCGARGKYLWKGDRFLPARRPARAH